MSQTIQVSKKKGEVIFEETILKFIAKSFSLLKNGEYTLTIKKAISKRSFSQNGMMWMWFECLAQDTVADKQDFHDMYCAKFLSRTVTIEGIETRVSKGTSKLDTVTMTHFLNQVQADAAAEFGVKLPTPDDLYWEDFENQYKRYTN